MSEVPGETPVTTPVAEPIVATAVLPLIHVPPAVVSLSVTVVPAQRKDVPKIAEGGANRNTSLPAVVALSPE
jgi:hypothetical protein